MSTRCNIEIYDDQWDKEKPGAILYHHSDGYPEFMLDKLNTFLKETYELLKEAEYPYWWDSERVASIMILLSVEDYKEALKPFSTDRHNKCDNENMDDAYRPYHGIPVFQPCLTLHSDIDYVYKIHLTKEGKYYINHEGT